MAWIAEDRRHTQVATGQPLLTDDLKQHLRDRYFPRYPTKRAVLLPALHLVQHTYNWIPPQALAEVADFLEVAPAEVLDTASFYEEYWLKPKGKYLWQVCRSFACELMSFCGTGGAGKPCVGTRELTEHLMARLGVDVGETTEDGRHTLVELECLGACGGAPVMLVNDVLFENVTPESIDAILAKLPDDPHDFRDPEQTWDDGHGH